MQFLKYYDIRKTKQTTRQINLKRTAPQNLQEGLPLKISQYDVKMFRIFREKNHKIYKTNSYRLEISYIIVKNTVASENPNNFVRKHYFRSIGSLRPIVPRISGMV